MGERRVSGWFVLSAVFLVLVFGLFFTFTERKTWPEHRIELGPMDMRLVPPVSTVWCEAVALYSNHSFVAYQVSHDTETNPMRMNLQRVNQQIKLGSSWRTSNAAKLKYFLLPSSIIEIFACASRPQAKILVFKGDLDVQSCLQNLVYKEFSESSEYDSDSDSSEDDDDDSYREDEYTADMFSRKKFCSSLLAQKFVDVGEILGYSTECSMFSKLYPLKVNVTSTDEYVIVIWNMNRHGINHVNVKILLDRTRYVVQGSRQAFDICSLSNACTIGLDFASGNRVLVTMPEEPNSGRSTFIVLSRCKPRLAVFAILSVFLPLLLFLAVAFVVRADRDAFFSKLCCRKENTRQLNRPRFVATYLDNQNAESFESFPIPEEERLEQLDEMPPPYHTLYDAPPPYACVEKEKEKISQPK